MSLTPTVSDFHTRSERFFGQFVGKCALIVSEGLLCLDFDVITDFSPISIDLSRRIGAHNQNITAEADFCVASNCSGSSENRRPPFVRSEGDRRRRGEAKEQIARHNDGLSYRQRSGESARE